jgi:hypothetical protein
MQLIVKDDKLQKYRDHVQHGLGLSTKDKSVFDRYFYAFHQLLDGQSERQVVKLLMNLPEPMGGVSQSQAYNIVNGAQEIFGVLDLSNSKKTAQRYIYATRLEEMAARLEELAEDTLTSEAETGEAEKEAGVLFEKAANVLMKAAKVRGLLEKDKLENPNRWKVAPNIIFTDDLSALELQQEIEDTNYEDVTGNGGEAQEGEITPAESEG